MQGTSLADAAVPCMSSMILTVNELCTTLAHPGSVPGSMRCTMHSTHHLCTSGMLLPESCCHEKRTSRNMLHGANIFLQASYGLTHGRQRS